MDGVFAFLKPPGITSHDAVAICRRILKEKRIGHSGTLDPLAYGVLPIFLGKATRLIEYTGDVEKTYVAECRFGTFTDTEDSTGNPVGNPVSPDAEIPTMTELAVLCKNFEGVQEQQPSIYSAIKINGVRAYELARAGHEVVLPSRTITIHSIDLLAYAYPFFTIRVRCSAGTYIRSLLRDLCKMVGIPGAMTQLARTQVGMYTLEEAVTAEELMCDGAIHIRAADSVISYMEILYFDKEQILALKQGKQLALTKDLKNTIPNQLYRAYDGDRFLGVVKRTDHSIKVEKNIFL